MHPSTVFLLATTVCLPSEATAGLPLVLAVLMSGQDSIWHGLTETLLAALFDMNAAEPLG